MNLRDVVAFQKVGALKKVQIWRRFATEYKASTYLIPEKNISTSCYVYAYILYAGLIYLE